MENKVLAMVMAGGGRERLYPFVNSLISEGCQVENSYIKTLL